jgi:hypothetical protein
MLLAIVLIVAVPVGGLWLWGRPRAHVPLPTAATTPTEVIRSYARAMNERDFGACKRMGVGDAGDARANWTTLHGPEIRDLKIDDVADVTTGRLAAKDPWSDPDLRHWEQTVVVDTTETVVNFDGQPDPEGHVYSFELVRHGSSQPWRIYSYGEG